MEACPPAPRAVLSASGVFWMGVISMSFRTCFPQGRYELRFQPFKIWQDILQCLPVLALNGGQRVDEVLFAHAGDELCVKSRSGDARHHGQVAKLGAMRWDWARAKVCGGRKVPHLGLFVERKCASVSDEESSGCASNRPFWNSHPNLQLKCSRRNTLVRWLRSPSAPDKSPASSVPPVTPIFLLSQSLHVFCGTASS